jgi:hypothetical protein
VLFIFKEKSNFLMPGWFVAYNYSIKYYVKQDYLIG